MTEDEKAIWDKAWERKMAIWRNSDLYESLKPIQDSWTKVTIPFSYSALFRSFLPVRRIVELAVVTGAIHE